MNATRLAKQLGLLNAVLMYSDRKGAYTIKGMHPRAGLITFGVTVRQVRHRRPVFGRRSYTEYTLFLTGEYLARIGTDGERSTWRCDFRWGSSAPTQKNVALEVQSQLRERYPHLVPSDDEIAWHRFKRSGITEIVAEAMKDSRLGGMEDRSIVASLAEMPLQHWHLRFKYIADLRAGVRERENDPTRSDITAYLRRALTVYVGEASAAA